MSHLLRSVSDWSNEIVIQLLSIFIRAFYICFILETSQVSAQDWNTVPDTD